MATYEYLISEIQNQTEQMLYSTAGQNKRSVDDSAAEQTARELEIPKIEGEVQKLLEQISDDVQKKTLSDAFEALKNLSKSKSRCSTTLKSIASLENECWTLSRQLDLRTISLQQLSKDDRNCLASAEEMNTLGKNLPGFIGQAAQVSEFIPTIAACVAITRDLGTEGHVMVYECLYAVKENWEWVLTLVKCIDVHLQNSASYHQFFHEIEESERWMTSELEKISKSFDILSMEANEASANELLSEMEEIHLQLRQWQAKSDRLWSTAVKLLPIPLRIQGGVTKPTPALAIANYATKEIRIKAGEDVLLEDNLEDQNWKVRNGKGEVGSVPALAIVIPGLDEEAIQASARLRFELLTYWTNALKHFGKRLIYFMLKVFKAEYSPEEIAALQSLESWEKEGLLMALTFIEMSFQKYWSEYEGYINLQERIAALKMILEDYVEQPPTDSNRDQVSSLLDTISALNQLSAVYQDMFNQWELFKVSMDVSRAPELMLILDKWEQLQYVSRENFSKFWKTGLPIDSSDNGLDDMDQFTLGGEHISDEVRMRKGGSDKDSEVECIEDIINMSCAAICGTTFQEAGLKEKKVEEVTIETDENESGVVTLPVEKKDVDGKGARLRTGKAGIEGSEGEGLDEIKSIDTRNLDSSVVDGSSLEIASRSETADTEQVLSSEKEESQTFSIRAVVNPVDNSEVTLDKAVELGIIRPKEGVYFNKVTGESVPIQIAMMNGQIKVVFSTKKVSKEKTSSVGIITIKSLKEGTRPYVITSVEDTETGEILTQEQAVSRGILNIEQGTFKDRKTGKKQLITEAKEHVKLEFRGEAPAPEEVVKKYAVRAVVDRKLKKTVTFHEAIKQGIIDKNTGEFRDTLTGEKMYVGDAIVKGFLKARVVDDVSDLNIDPTNVMVVDKTKALQTKLLKPLAVLSAFKKSAAK